MYRKIVKLYIENFSTRLWQSDGPIKWKTWSLIPYTISLSKLNQIKAPSKTSMAVLSVPADLESSQIFCMFEIIVSFHLVLFTLHHEVIVSIASLHGQEGKSRRCILYWLSFRAVSLSRRRIKEIRLRLTIQGFHWVGSALELSTQSESALETALTSTQCRFIQGIFHWSI